MSETRSTDKRTPRYRSPECVVDCFVVCCEKPEVFQYLCLDPSYFCFLFKPLGFQYFCLTDAHLKELPFVVMPSCRSSKELLFFENGIIRAQTTFVPLSVRFFDIVLKQFLDSFFYRFMPVPGRARSA